MKLIFKSSPLGSRCGRTLVPVCKNLAKIISRLQHTNPKLKRDESTTDFDMRYAAKVYDRNYDELKSVVKVETSSTLYRDPVIVFPGFEGRMSCVSPLIKNMGRTTYCTQYPFEKSTGKTSDIAESLFPILNECIEPGSRVNMVAHSFGGLVAFDVIKLMYKAGRRVRICLSDASPDALKIFGHHAFGDVWADNFDSQFLCRLLRSMDVKNVDMFTGIIDSSLAFEEKVEILSRILPEYCSFESTDVRAYAIGMYHVVRSMQFYDENFPKLECEAALIRPSTRIWHFPEDYNISQYFEKNVDTHFTDGHHVTMLKSEKTASLINRVFES